MWLLTSVVSTVPGTVAGYQPAGLKAAVEISAPGCGTLDASCNCQPEETMSGAGARDWAEAPGEARIEEIKTMAKESGTREAVRPKRICTRWIPRYFLGGLAAVSSRTEGL